MLYFCSKIDYMENLPAEFILRTKKLLGNDWDSFLSSLETESPVSIRLNPNKNLNEDIPTIDIVPWCCYGMYLEKRPQFTFDPLFHAGCYYVQEASSMFVGQVLKQYVDDDVKVLDLCAAPGGKSTLISDCISKDSLLVSNEVIRSRANILAENMAKWGKANVVVTNNDPSRFSKLEGYFDIIVVDAPCSGEGMFRKDRDAMNEWSVENVKLCKERQQRILADVWPALKPGGLLVYSTCTYNLEENEENVRWIKEELGAENLVVNIEPEWGICPSFADDVTAYRFFPHKVRGEGFFLSVLKKNVDEDIKPAYIKRGKNGKPDKVTLESKYKNYILDKAEFTFYPLRDNWCAFPEVLANDLTMLQSVLNIVSAGIDMGTLKGKDFIPDQGLAISQCLNREIFHTCDIDWKTAINYLRKEPLALEDQPKGIILLTYRNIPLGFVKNIGNRANNLYPQEWRIRSSNIPGEPIKVV